MKAVKLVTVGDFSLKEINKFVKDAIKAVPLHCRELVNIHRSLELITITANGNVVFSAQKQNKQSWKLDALPHMIERM